MKKLGVLFFLCLPTIFSVVNAEEEGVHRFGTFNVRYVAKNGDTGERLWTNRKDRVLQIVTDYDYDIIGFNEVTGSNKDETGATVNQKQDMETYLKQHGYATVAYEREDRQYSWNLVAYKTSKYTCLDHMSFWLSATPYRVSYGWDCGSENNIYRRCIVMHMQDNTTKEEFYFCATHVNYGLYSSGYNSARVMTDIIREKANGKPVVLVGDINMNRSAHTAAYRGYAAYFMESNLLADENYCLPKTNPSVTFTTNNWTAPGKPGCSGSEFDHIFYNKMHCLSHHIVTETYGKDVTPSDHFPLLVRFRLEPEHQTRYVVSSEKELLDAMAAAYPADTIFLTKGTLSLSQPLQLTKSLCLIGGYNKISKQVTADAYTTIQLTSTGQSVIQAGDWYSLVMENIIIEGQTITAAAGGGAVCCNGSLLSLSNCQFRDLSAPKGGAVASSADRSNIDYCVFECNSANNNGGAVLLSANSEVRIFNNIFSYNTAPAGSAVCILSAETCNIQNNSFIANVATKQGALYAAAYDGLKSINFLNCAFINNTLNAKSGLSTITKYYGGAAVNVNTVNAQQKVNVGHCSMIGNKTTYSGSSNFTGAALNVFGGNTCVMNCLIVGNSTTMSDGVLKYVDMDDTKTNLWRNTYNVYTTNLTDFENTVSATLGGFIAEDGYTPFVTSKKTYQLKQTTLCGYNLKCLPTVQRMCETAFEFDLNEDGTIGGSIMIDMLAYARGVTACIGAVEYTGQYEPETGFSNPQSSFPNSPSGAHSSTYKVLRNGQIILEKNHSQYNILGQSL